MANIIDINQQQKAGLSHKGVIMYEENDIDIEPSGAFGWSSAGGNPPGAEDSKETAKDLDISSYDFGRLKAFIKREEGFHGIGKESLEGGSDTVGWGHKLKEGEDILNFQDYDAEDFEILLNKDMEAAFEQAENSTNNKYEKDGIVFDDLDFERKAILVDWVYNTGQVPWMHEPNTKGRLTHFGEAVVAGSFEDMINEDGQRYFKDAKTGESKPLGRDKRLEEQWISPHVKKESKIDKFKTENKVFDAVKGVGGLEF